MTQQRIFNFQEDDSTQLLNRARVLPFKPGRYSGFDFLPTSDLNLTLRHTTTGTQLSSYDAVPIDESFKGVVITRQGVLITEDAQIVLPVSPGDATNPRVDSVVLTHRYISSPGGSQGTYSIIQGSPQQSPIPPLLSDPPSQVIIGNLFIPAGMTNLQESGVVFTPSRAADIGDLNLNSRITNNESQIEVMNNSIIRPSDDTTPDGYTFVANIIPEGGNAGNFGPELLDEPQFSNQGNWQLDSGVTISGGILNFNFPSDEVNRKCQQIGVNLEEDKAYLLRISHRAVENFPIRRLSVQFVGNFSLEFDLPNHGTYKFKENRFAFRWPAPFSATTFIIINCQWHGTLNAVGQAIQISNCSVTEVDSIYMYNRIGD